MGASRLRSTCHIEETPDERGAVPAPAPAEVVATAHRSPYLSGAYTGMLALDAWRVATLLGT